MQPGEMAAVHCCLYAVSASVPLARKNAGNIAIMPNTYDNSYCVHHIDTSASIEHHGESDWCNACRGAARWPSPGKPSMPVLGGNLIFSSPRAPRRCREPTVLATERCKGRKPYMVYIQYQLRAMAYADVQEDDIETSWMRTMPGHFATVNTAQTRYWPRSAINSPLLDRRAPKPQYSESKVHNRPCLMFIQKPARRVLRWEREEFRCSLPGSQFQITIQINART